MNLEVITVCSHPEYAGRLLNSATKHGYKVNLIHVAWQGFGTKIIETHRFLKEHPDITHFIFADAFDTICLMPKDEFSPAQTEQILFNSEKNCWPDSSLSSLYPNTDSPFKYLNSGLYYASRELWMQMVEENPVRYEDDDQLYFTRLFLSVKYPINLDNYQYWLNAHSFIAENEYTYNDGKMQYLGRDVCWVHLNGRTVDEKLEKMLEGMGL